MPSQKTPLKSEGTELQVILAGGTAGLVSRFCIAPLDVIKIRLQLQTHSLSDPLSIQRHQGPVYKGTFGTLRDIVRDEGFTALWKGNIPAELLYVTYGASQFSTYRYTSRLFESLPPHRRLPDTVESFISGACAGYLATTITYPLDILRTRFAAQGTEKVYSGFLTGIRDIARHEGARGFFRGSTAALAQIVPYMGLFFASYETLKLSFSNINTPFGTGDALSGIIASIFSKTSVFPLDTVRKRLQVQGPTRSRYVHRNIPSYNGVVSTIMTIGEREGIRGLYRGLPVSLIKAAPASAITMWTYEQVLSSMRGIDD